MTIDEDIGAAIHVAEVAHLMGSRPGDMTRVLRALREAGREIRRWRQLAEEHQQAAEGVADLYVEIQEAVAAAHGQLTDDGLIDDDYDAAEGVRLLCADRDRLAERVGEDEEDGT